VRVLLDEGVPHPLAKSLTGHEVRTVDDIGCNGVKNGKLLQIIEELRFDIFITADKNIPNQQELARRPFAVLLLSTNNWPILRTRTGAISSAIDAATPGTVTRVDCGSFVSTRRTGHLPR
jgi:hypothetical protein